MCVIIACEAGSRPSVETLETAFWMNPDGAGVAWPEGGVVHVRKGLMRVEDLLDAVSGVPEGAPMLVHARIATSGGTSPEATHPFPLSDSLDDMHLLSYTADTVVAHNGVLREMETDDKAMQSDSMTYVMRWLTGFSRAVRVQFEGGLACSDTAKRLIADTSRGSRIAVMDGFGNLRMVGSGWVDVTEGVHASNMSCMPIGHGWAKDSYYSWHGPTTGRWEDSWDDGWGFGWERPARAATQQEAEELYDEYESWYGMESCDGGEVGTEVDADGLVVRYHLPKDCGVCQWAGSCSMAEPECREIAEWCDMNSFVTGDADDVPVLVSVDGGEWHAA